MAGRTVLAGCALALTVGLTGCGSAEPGTAIGGPIPTTTTAAVARGAPATTGATTPAPTTTTARPPATSRPATTTSAAPAAPRCTTGQFRGSFGPQQGAGRTKIGVVVLTNVSSRTCTVYGYGDLIITDGADQPIFNNGILREASPAPALLTVPPGTSIFRDIHFYLPPGGTEADCPTPAKAAITPPDETSVLRLSWPYGPVCGFKAPAYRKSAG